MYIYIYVYIYIYSYIYICIYYLSSIYIIFLDLVEYSQKNKFFSFIIHVEKLIKFQHRLLSSIRFYIYKRFYFYKCLHTFNLTMFPSQ